VLNASRVLPRVDDVVDDLRHSDAVPAVRDALHQTAEMLKKHLK